MRITRRQVLAAAAAVPVAGGLAAGATAWRWWDRPAGEGLKALAPEEHDFVQALAEAWLPPGGNPPLSGAEAQLGRFFDDVVAAMAPGTARELKLLLHALDAMPWATHLGAFRGLSLETRSAIVEGWVHSDQWLLRNAVTGVLVFVGEGYAMHPDVIGILRPHFRCGYGP